MFYSYIFFAITALVYVLAITRPRLWGMFIAVPMVMLSFTIVPSMERKIAFNNAMDRTAQEIAAELSWDHSSPFLYLGVRPLCQHDGQVRDGRLTSAQFKKAKEACALGVAMFKEAAQIPAGPLQGYSVNTSSSKFYAVSLGEREFSCYVNRASGEILPASRASAAEFAVVVPACRAVAQDLR